MAEPQTPNYNAAQKNLGKMVIAPKGGDDMRSIEFYLKKVPIPGMEDRTVDVPNRVIDMKLPSGAKPKHPTEISIDVQLDDRLRNYFKLCAWRERNSNSSQTKGEFDGSLANKATETTGKDPTGVQWAGKGLLKTREELPKSQQTEFKTPTEWEELDYRDITIELRDTNNIVYGFLAIYDAFPINIPGFESEYGSTEPIMITVTFGYLYHKFLDAEREPIF